MSNQNARSALWIRILDTQSDDKNSSLHHLELNFNGKATEESLDPQRHAYTENAVSTHSLN